MTNLQFCNIRAKALLERYPYVTPKKQIHYKNISTSSFVFLINKKTNKFLSADENIIRRACLSSLHPANKYTLLEATIYDQMQHINIESFINTNKPSIEDFAKTLDENADAVIERLLSKLSPHKEICYD